MTPVYTLKLCFQVRKTNVEVQIINISPLEMFGIVIANFLLQDKLKRAWFFQEIFSLANTSMKMVLEILFLIISKETVCFAKKKLK